MEVDVCAVTDLGDPIKLSPNPQAPLIHTAESQTAAGGVMSEFRQSQWPG